jgi:hypothetical protein
VADDDDDRLLKIVLVTLIVLVAAYLAGMCWGSYELIGYVTSNRWK